MKKTQDNDLFAPCVGKLRELKRARERAESLRAQGETAAESEAQARAGAPSSDAVKEQRENFAAARAIGQLTSEELRKRGAELDALSQAAEKAQAAAQAAADVRAGIERMLQVAEDDIRRLNDERRELLERALCEKAERIGDEYLDAARKTHELFVQLVALERLASHVGGNRNRFLGPAAHEFSIPAFRFASHRQATEHHGRSVGFRLFDWSETDRSDKQVPQAVDAETERLRALGVEIYV